MPHRPEAQRRTTEMPIQFDIPGRQTCSPVAASFIVVAMALLVPSQTLAQQAPASETRTIERRSGPPRADQDKKKFRTREQRLQEKPLDWNATIGTPAPEAVAPPGETAPAAQPGTVEGGAPNPKADDDARRAFPNEW